ncbi:unnamed protein product [Heterotrigona itama]|uniref:Uncharacterized protein n=1 Tax=Heterotrigona itama TaxID=395501 RepID=A0A6V7H797_9HYME|nr:unnamed protein product [Heterotrigona itama]
MCIVDIFTPTVRLFAYICSITTVTTRETRCSRRSLNSRNTTYTSESSTLVYSEERYDKKKKIVDSLNCCGFVKENYATISLSFVENCKNSNVSKTSV